MRRCAAPTPDRPATWITDEFVASYSELHRRGHAHSVEVYEGDEIVGGLYGVTIGGFFGGESMFHTRTDASKAAVGYLIERLRAGGFTLLDAQMPTPHLARLGAVNIPRSEYLARLRAALEVKASFSACVNARGRPRAACGLLRTHTRFRPDRFASYIISSATAIRSAGDCTPGCGVPATPTLMVTRMDLPS